MTVGTLKTAPSMWGGTPQTNSIMSQWAAGLFLTNFRPRKDSRKKRLLWRNRIRVALCVLHMQCFFSLGKLDAHFIRHRYVRDCYYVIQCMCMEHVCVCILDCSINNSSSVCILMLAPLSSWKKSFLGPWRIWSHQKLLVSQNKNHTLYNHLI